MMDEEMKNTVEEQAETTEEQQPAVTPEQQVDINPDDEWESVEYDTTPLQPEPEEDSFSLLDYLDTVIGIQMDIKTSLDELLKTGKQLNKYLSYVAANTKNGNNVTVKINTEKGKVKTKKKDSRR